MTSILPKNLRAKCIMQDLVSAIVNKIVSTLAKDIGSKIAQKIKEKYGRKLKGRLSEFLFGKSKKPPYKLLIIGGGEIGTEVGIAARNRGWYVRGICYARDYPGKLDKTTLASIRNLPFYRDERICDKHHFYYTAEKVNPNEPFQWTAFRKLEIDVLKDVIIREKPDVVLLEDMFLTPMQWKNLNRMVLGELKEKEHIFFMPPTAQTEQGMTYSDIFLSKIRMKEFLTEIGMQSYLLGKKDHYIKAENLLKKPQTKEYLDEVKKLENALRKCDGGKIILKFDTISSGHGQFTLSDISFLNPDMIRESLDYGKHRVPNEFYVFEKYLADKEEVCAIVARTNEGKIGINRIYYKKYDMEKSKSKRFRWVTRLITSESKTGVDNTVWIRLNRIAKNISRRLPVPFLYIEFILDKSKKPKPDIYINEISYRPDDAGFISHISHSKDQFTLLIESLENLLEKGELEQNGKEPEYVEQRGEYRCVTINPGKKPMFLTEHITWPLYGKPWETKFKLSLYEKHLYERNGEIDYGRIVGYIWHSTGEDPKELLGEYKSSLGQDEETYKIIFDTLSEAEKA